MSKWHRIREKEVLVGLSFAGNFPVAISFYSDEGLENSCINIMAIIYHHMNYVASDKLNLINYEILLVFSILNVMIFLCSVYSCWIWEEAWTKLF